ncbi:MAG TPA: helix-turn-helix domain-containing protein, partial [Thiobacillus sp.]
MSTLTGHAPQDCCPFSAYDIVFRMTASVSSVERALAILELLASPRAGLTLPEIARRVKIPKSSA